MKNLLVIILISICAIPAVNGQEARTILKVRLTNNQPLTIEIDGRRFKKANSKLTVADVPKGKHYLKVYRFIPYSDRRGGRAELLFEGTVKLAPYTMAYCIVDAKTGRLEFFDHDIETPNADDEREFNGEAAATDATNNTEGQTEGRDYDKKEGLSQKEMTDLQNLVEDKMTDSEKMALLQNELLKKHYSTEQVRIMMNWLSFESSKLDLAKWSYKRVTDKENYNVLVKELSFSSSKQELSDYIKGK